MKKQILLTLIALISLGSLQAADPSEVTPTQSRIMHLLKSQNLAKEISTAFNKSFALNLMTDNHFKEAIDTNNKTKAAICMAKKLYTLPAIAATTTYNHVKTNCTHLLLKSLETQYNLGESYLSNKLNFFYTTKNILYFTLPVYIEYVTNNATQGFDEQGIYFTLNGGLPLCQNQQLRSKETPYERFRRLDKETPEQRKTRFENLRKEVAKEKKLLEDINNEDKKYALIQDISTSQKAHDSFVDEALYFYHRHATEVEKAQLKPLFEKATNNMQNIEALMASVKQTLHSDDINFETNMKSFHKRIQTFERIHTELSNSLKALKKPLPEML